MKPKLSPHAFRPAAQNALPHSSETTYPKTSSVNSQAHAAESGQLMRPGDRKQASRRLHRKLAAVYIGTSLSWLDKSRLRGDGPVYLQIGGRIIYDTTDLDRFMAERRRRSTSEVL